MNPQILLLSLVLFTSCARSQPPSATFSKTTISVQDTSGLYVEDGVSGSLFYLSMAPEKPARGMLVLLPPNGEPASVSATINSGLAATARDSGLVTIVLSINHNLYMDATTTAAMNAMLEDAISRFKVPRSKIVLGGFSLGGMNAVRYTELSKEPRPATTITPAGVYAIDPPLDWSRIYYSFRRAVARNKAQAAVAEASYFLSRLDTEFGGSPAAQPEIYRQRSMYSADASDGGNAAYLRTVPVRIYSDYDTAWWQVNRGVPPEDINATEGRAMIQELQKLGNDRAEWINALGKGFRPDGTRHPHSWSLVEPRATLAWVLRCLR